MKNTKNKGRSALSIARPLYYISQVERDLIVIAFAQILAVEKPQENFTQWVLATINKISSDTAAVRKIIDHLDSQNKMRAAQTEEWGKELVEKDQLLRVFLPHYLKSLG